MIKYIFYIVLNPLEINITFKNKYNIYIISFVMNETNIGFVKIYI